MACFINLKMVHYFNNAETEIENKLVATWENVSSYIKESITKTRLFKYIENSLHKTENFQIKNSNSFHISAKNIDCGYSLEPPRRGGSNDNPQYMFLSRNKEHNVYPCKSQFFYVKVGVKGVKII